MTTHLDDTKKRLLWQCRRGMLELDVLLKNFVEVGYETLASEDQQLFEIFLKTDDPTLYAWFMKQEDPPCQFQRLINVIKS
jgi:antitoxin CptB